MSSGKERKRRTFALILLQKDLNLSDVWGYRSDGNSSTSVKPEIELICKLCCSRDHMIVSTVLVPNSVYWCSIKAMIIGDCSHLLKYIYIFMNIIVAHAFLIESNEWNLITRQCNILKLVVFLDRRPTDSTQSPHSWLHTYHFRIFSLSCYLCEYLTENWCGSDLVVWPWASEA